MNEIIEKTLFFFIDNFPTWKAILIGGPVCLIWSYCCLLFAGYLKQNKGLKTGYTRKIFHFLTFTTVVLIQIIWDTSIVCLFGGICSLVIFYALFKGNGHILYEAMAREKDMPHRTHYIIIPYFATLIGGLVSNILFGTFAIVGYLVTGLGDAVGEPVGTRFGKHTYKVPSLKPVKAIRSIEGSAAVFIACIIAITLGIAISAELKSGWLFLLIVLILSISSALVEAVSPHGWDNLTMQVIPSLMAEIFISITSL